MTEDPQIWHQLPFPLLQLNRLGVILAVNSAGEGFLNQSERSLLGQLLVNVLPGAAPIADALTRVQEDQAPVTISDVDFLIKERPDAGKITFSPLPDGILCMLQPNESGVRMGRDQQAKSAARSAAGLAAMLAHEIKNPLAGIAGAAQLLEMNLSEDDKELTVMIVEETRRIVKLLEQVERFGNLRPPALQVVNIHDVLDRARRSAELGHAAHMKIYEDYDPSLPPTYADPDQLVQIILNILKNAAEAARGEPGTIRLKTRVDHGLRRRNAAGLTIALPLSLEITDDGPGIPPDLMAQVFDPFVSGRENGTGLGLALVSKVIADHGGWISVESRPGRTSFRIALPLAPRE